eukprot:TRINITY_DN9336_c0_g1_i4.p2 TRINITY_DN9336_c0_g1~~TRINITY_DN9336_c0_g1_i4.p2  ORF type:complete len:294 (+),score=40.51 TRINITY_DN9336_c0_g1_i4:272-1153(+)
MCTRGQMEGPCLTRDSDLLRAAISSDPVTREAGIAAFREYFTQDPERTRACLPLLRYLASDAPVSEVRCVCCEILDLPADSLEVTPPSVFMGVDLFRTETISAETCSALTASFVASARVLNFERIMGMHHEYLAVFQRTHAAVVYGSGPLPVPTRLYILILAAAHVDSVCVVELFQEEFKEHGGELAWLEGVAHAPVKLQKLLPVISMLADSPWKLTVETVAEVLSAEAGEPWSTGEFVHALALMASGDMLGKFASGCGVTHEPSLSMFRCEESQRRDVSLTRSDSGRLLGES